MVIHGTIYDGTGNRSSCTGTRRGRRPLAASIATLSSLWVDIILSRKKLKCTSDISQTIGRNLPTHTLICSHADELKIHSLSSSRSSGNPAGLQWSWQYLSSAECLLTAWKTSTGNPIRRRLSSCTFTKWDSNLQLLSKNKNEGSDRGKCLGNVVLRKS